MFGHLFSGTKTIPDEMKAGNMPDDSELIDIMKARLTDRFNIMAKRYPNVSIHTDAAIAETCAVFADLSAQQSDAADAEMLERMKQRLAQSFLLLAEHKHEKVSYRVNGVAAQTAAAYLKVSNRLKALNAQPQLFL